MRVNITSTVQVIYCLHLLDHAAAKGNVASVTTFHGCLDVLDECSPVWAVFENVESVDREVDDDT